MKAASAIALALIAPLALLAGAACSTLPPGSAVSAPLDSAKAFVAAETAFDAAVQTADLAVTSGQVPKADIARLRSLADSGHVYVIAGRTAVTAANATDILTETEALTQLAAEIAALAPSKSSQ